MNQEKTYQPETGSLFYSSEGRIDEMSIPISRYTLINELMPSTSDDSSVENLAKILAE